MTFVEMLNAMRVSLDISRQDLARDLSISPQYLCDLEKGRRMPSVVLVERICKYLSRGPKGRRDWHIAGAKSHGWEVDGPLPRDEREIKWGALGRTPDRYPG